MKFNIQGLQKLMNNVKELSGKHTLKVTELFNVEFMRENTNFSNVEEMFEKSNLKLEIKEDIEKNQPAWDDFIRANTKYFSWEELIKAAGAKWCQKKLFS
jgi:hypothetical protein